MQNAAQLTVPVESLVAGRCQAWGASGAIPALSGSTGATSLTAS